jgi:hypothetical protein
MASVSNVHACEQLSLSVSFCPLAASPSFAATSSHSGRETHFLAGLGGEDAVEYLFCGYLLVSGGAGSGIQWVTFAVSDPTAVNTIQRFCSARQPIVTRSPDAPHAESIFTSTDFISGGSRLFFAEAHRLAVCIVNSFLYAHRTKRCSGLRRRSLAFYATPLG